jgi:hypothetical protein
LCVHRAQQITEEKLYYISGNEGIVEKVGTEQMLLSYNTMPRERGRESERAVERMQHILSNSQSFVAQIFQENAVGMTTWKAGERAKKVCQRQIKHRLVRARGGVR